MGEYYILEGHTTVPVNDLIQWGEMFANVEARRVALTKKNGIEISTVFLGMNHSFGNGPPLLFETLVFGGEHDGDMNRYSTWEEAEEGHKKMVETIFEKVAK